MKQWLSEKWDSLNSTSQKNKLILIVGVIVAGVLGKALYNDKQAGKLQPVEENHQQGVVAPTVKDPNLTTIQNQLSTMQTDINTLKNNPSQQKGMDQQQGGLTREEVVRLYEELRKNDINSGTGDNSFGKAGFGDTNTTASAAQTETEAGNMTGNLESSAPTESTSSGKGFRKEPLGQRQGTNHSKAETDDNKTFLPPATILSYVSLTGINAPTNLDGKNENPPMMLLRVAGKGIMPNGFTTDLSGCFVLASVYGQYMDSRVIGRPVKISCIRDDGKAVEAKLTGEITGEDGKPGWQGKTASKTGKVLAGLTKTMFLKAGADTLSGVANGINLNIGGSSTNGTARTQINLGGTAGQSIAQNVNSAADKMAAIYEKMGNDAIPVVMIGPKRKGQIIIQEGVSLDFVKDVR